MTDQNNEPAKSAGKKARVKGERGSSFPRAKTKLIRQEDGGEAPTAASPEKRGRKRGRRHGQARGVGRTKVAPAFEPGEVLAGRYRVERWIARGGMGEVYEVEDLALRTRVALKTIRPDKAMDAGSAERLRREILLARSIPHPSVCRVYDFGRHAKGDTEIRFLTMELLEGESLAARLRRCGRMSPHEAMPLVRQMAEALDAAHRAGVVHRDFKCANVHLVPCKEGGERAVVTDFGLAQEADPGLQEGDRITAPGLVLGTPEYIAPEQLAGQTVAASDIYALGIVVYEMMTGCLPFRGDTPSDIMIKRLTEEPVPPHEVVPDMEETWEKGILCCLRRSPDERFVNALDLVKVLEGETPEQAPRPIPAALPVERDSFVGRQRELADLGQKLAGGTRLISVVGPGGVGKTRLAQRCGAMMATAFPGGVWFCDLSEARGPEGITTILARVLDVPLGKADPVVQLGHAVAGRRRCLMILDNFEQIVDHAEATVGRWVQQATEAVFLVTSRERLHVPGEDVFSLEPMSLSSDAVDLFVVRARSQRSDFVLTPANEPEVRDVVRLLDGLPLAIELAAARIAIMSPGRIIERLRDRFTVLAGVRDAKARQATLRGAIDWSWALLSTPEQAAFAQCSVFRGGFTLEAAEAVIDLSPCSTSLAVMDVLQALLDKSLVRSFVPQALGRCGIDEPHFAMYLGVQEYAQVKLRTEGELPMGASGAAAEDAAFRRHGAYFARFGTDDALDALDRQGGVAKRRAREIAIDNAFAACHRAIEREDGAMAANLCMAFWAAMELRGPYRAFLPIGRRALGLSSLSPVDRARVSSSLGRACWLAGLAPEGFGYAENALALFLELGHEWGAARVFANLGLLHQQQGRGDQARENHEKALALARKAGARDLEGIALGNLAVCFETQGRMAEALDHNTRALAIHREVGNRRLEGSVHGNLGLICYQQGRFEQAGAHYEQALALHRETGNRRGEGSVLGNLGILHFTQGKTKTAGEHYEAALSVHREVGDRQAEGTVLGSLAGLLMETGRTEEARASYEQALAVIREVGHRRMEGIVLGNLGLLHREQGRLAEARACCDQALTILREVKNRRVEGLALAFSGVLCRDQGAMAEARGHFEGAIGIAREVGDRRLEGMVLGESGLLLAMDGRPEAARETFENGTRLLGEIGDHVELGKLQCIRGQAELLAGDLVAARSALDQARLLARQIGSDLPYGLGREITKLENALAARSAAGREKD